jgi:hypothetical protein
MLKRIVLVAFVIVAVWVAASSELTAHLRPYIERGTEFFWELAGEAKRRVEGFRETSSVLRPVEEEKAPSEEHVEIGSNPFQDLIDQGVVSEEFRDRRRTLPEGKSSDKLPVQAETYELPSNKRDRSETEEFPDLYEKAKDSLFQAMKILEGRESESR